MKTVFTCLIAACLFFSCCNVLSAQQTPVADDKKITITKHTTEADGSDVTETIVEKGTAAANFDVDTYVRENRSDHVQVDVRVENTKTNHASHETIKKEVKKDGKKISSWSSSTTSSACCQDNGAFLGVDADSDEDESQPGVVVEVVRNSAAYQAGLKTNDVLMRINDQPINRWSDLTACIAKAKPGDKVQITYQRNGQEATTEAILGRHSDVKIEDEDDEDNQSNSLELSNDEQEDNGSWNWVNEDVNVDVQQKEACLGVYTEGVDQDDEEGARILSFTSESAAKEVQMQENDVITAVNGQKVQDHSGLWAEIAKYKAGDRVKVDYLRNGEKHTVETALKPCQDNTSRVTVQQDDEQGRQKKRQFTTWNWDREDQEQMRENRMITIHKGGEGDAAKVNTPLPGTQPADHQLKLESFRAYPNPAQGQITVEFRGAPVATIVSLLDMSGRQLFREELNLFRGDYKQQFDLSEYAKGTIIILVQQGDKSLTEQIVIN